jgi:hypothetical protein
MLSGYSIYKKGMQNPKKYVATFLTMVFSYIDGFLPKTGIFDRNKMLKRNCWSNAKCS